MDQVEEGRDDGVGWTNVIGLYLRSETLYATGACIRSSCSGRQSFRGTRGAVNLTELAYFLQMAMVQGSVSGIYLED